MRKRLYNRCLCGNWKRITSYRCRKCHAKAYAKSNSKRLKGKPPRGTGWKHSQETRDKIRRAWTEEKRKQAQDRGNQFSSVYPHWRKKVSSFGESNPRWKGGVASSKYAPGFDRKLKQSIRERDDFTCLLCGVTEEEVGYRHSIHHIDFDKTNHNHDNLATTCKACNSRANTNESVWFSYFTTLVEMRRKLGKDVLKLVGRKVFSQQEGFCLITHLP